MRITVSSCRRAGGSVVAGTLVGLLALSPAARANGDLETLADALITAGEYAVPGSEFLTVLKNADLIAIAALKVALNTKVKEALIDGDDRKLAIAQDLLAKSQDTKVAKERLHEKQGEDPWSARFNVTTPGFALPTTAGATVSGTATIDTTAFRTASWVLPAVLGAPSPRQEPEGTLTFEATLLPSGDLSVRVDALNFGLPGFAVAVPGHTNTGVNLSSFPSGTVIAKREPDGSYSGSLAAPGVLVNDLWPASNPALDLLKAQFRVFPASATEPFRFLVAAQDTLLVPSPTPASQAPIAYAPSQVVFDPGAGAIRFVDPFSGASAIAVLALDAADGSFLSALNGFMGRLPGAPSLRFADLVIRSRSATDVTFDDVAFELLFDATLAVSGRLTDIRLDLARFDLLGDTADIVFHGPGNALVDLFRAGHVFQFMSPMAAALLYAGTEGLSTALTGPYLLPEITIVNHNSVPEPASIGLIALAGLIVLRVGARRDPPAMNASAAAGQPASG